MIFPAGYGATPNTLIFIGMLLVSDKIDIKPLITLKPENVFFETRKER